MPYRTLAEIFADKIVVVQNPKVKLTLSADDWELLGRYNDTGRFANRENVAVALNDQISEAINTSANMEEAFKRCSSILTRHSDYGAADTEGREMLETIFELTYGQDF